VAYPALVKGRERRRSLLHVDLDPFFVSVERSLDADLRGRPVIVGGDAASSGIVAAASSEARDLGVRPGQSLATARRLCPQGVFRSGDLDAYARVSEEVTGILLATSRRVERPSADEAYVDLTPEGPGSGSPVPLAEQIKDELQRRLGLDAALGVASCRLAARVASSWARPRGLLVVLPGYEASFLARQPLSFLPDLPPHLEDALTRAGFATLGDILAASDDVLTRAVGPAAFRVREAAAGDGELPVEVAAPPSWLQEEVVIRDKHPDRAALETVLGGLVARGCRRLRPFDLAAETVTVEVRRQDRTLKRSETLAPGLAEEATAREVVAQLAQPLLDPAVGVRSLQVRLGRLTRRDSQVPLFPRRSGGASAS
jgi:DNA polymerase-4